MSDYIDKDISLNIISTTDHPEYPIECVTDITDLVYKAIKELPPADVKPVVRGEWIERHDDNIILGHCSVCGWQAINGETDVMGMNFCPDCGAYMRPQEVEE